MADAAHRPLRVVEEPQVPDGASDAEAREHAEVARARAQLPTLDARVFDCYLGGLVDKIEPTSEADPINIYATLLTGCGVHLGRGPHLRLGDDYHPLLLWPLIVGKTSSGRKGAGWNSGRRLLAATDGDFVTTNQRSGLTTGEGLAAMFHPDPDTTDDDTAPDGDGDGEDDPAADADTAAWSKEPGKLPPGDHRLLLYEPEWGGVMARMKREGNSLSATLRAAWEGGDLSTLSVTARIARNTHIGIVAHITPKEFRSKVSASDMAGGTYNRFLPLAVARSKFQYGGGGMDPDLLNQMAGSLRDRLTLGATVGHIGFSTEGLRMWRDLYVEFGAEHGDHPTVEEFIARSAPNCLRIAAIHAALDGTDHITPNHLTPAAALVRYSIDTARTVFTDSRATARLLAYIADAGTTGRTRKQITTDHFGGNTRADDITALLDQLQHAGKITRSSRPRADGRPGKGTEIYTATEPQRT